LALVEPMFNLFIAELEGLGLIVNEGKIIDASFVEVPIQRNKKEENEAIKAGKIPASFLENEHKLAQKIWMLNGQKRTM
jgi:transposase, IS5 family